MFRPFASPGSAGVCIPGPGNGYVAVLNSLFCKQSNSYFFIFNGGKSLTPQLEERISTIPMFSLTFAMMSVTSEDSSGIRENTFTERNAGAAKRALSFSQLFFNLPSISSWAALWNKRSHKCLNVIFILESDGVEGRFPLIIKEKGQTYWRNGCQSEDDEEKRNHKGGHLQLIPECERTVRTGSQNIKGSSTKRWR